MEAFQGYKVSVKRLIQGGSVGMYEALPIECQMVARVREFRELLVRAR